MIGLRLIITFTRQWNNRTSSIPLTPSTSRLLCMVFSVWLLVRCMWDVRTRRWMSVLENTYSNVVVELYRYSTVVTTYRMWYRSGRVIRCVRCWLWKVGGRGRTRRASLNTWSTRRLKVNLWVRHQKRGKRTILNRGRVSYATGRYKRTVVPNTYSIIVSPIQKQNQWYVLMTIKRRLRHTMTSRGRVSGAVRRCDRTIVPDTRRSGASLSQMCTRRIRAVSGSTRLNQWEYTTKHLIRATNVHEIGALWDWFCFHL